LKEWYGTRGKRKAKRASATPTSGELPLGRHEDQEDEYGEPVETEKKEA
jgi:hypothetical protein